MNQRTFLYQLQLIDNEIDKHNKQLIEIQKILNFNHDVIALQQDLDLLETEKKGKNQILKKFSDEASLIQNKISSSEQSLYDGSVKNPKELQSINLEIDSLRKRIVTLDEEQLDYLYQIEELDEKIDLKKAELSNLEQTKLDQRNNFQLKIEHIQKENNRLDIEKKTIINQIEDNFLEKYKLLRKTKNGVAVSLIVDNACALCGNSLPPMEVQKAKSSEDEVNCSVCKRFLFTG